MSRRAVPKANTEARSAEVCSMFFGATSGEMQPLKEFLE
jgi:hypothetical protein